MTNKSQNEFYDFLNSLNAHYSLLTASKTSQFYQQLAEVLRTNFDRMVIIGDSVKKDGVNPYDSGFYVIGVKGDSDDWRRFVRGHEERVVYVGYGSVYPHLIKFASGKRNFIGIDIDGTLVGTKFKEIMDKLVYRYAVNRFRQLTERGKPGSVSDVHKISSVPVNERIQSDLEVTIITAAIVWSMGYRRQSIGRLFSKGYLADNLRKLTTNPRSTPELAEYITAVVGRIENTPKPGITGLATRFREDQLRVSSPGFIHPYVDSDILGDINRTRRELERAEKEVVVALVTQSHRYKSWLSYGRTH